jgi:hypothetical protein
MTLQRACGVLWLSLVAGLAGWYWVQDALAGSRQTEALPTSIELTITMEADYQVWLTHDSKLWCFVTNVAVPRIVVTVPVTNSPTFWRAKLCTLPPPMVNWTTNEP